MASEWTKQQIEKYGVEFDAADTDKNGYLGFREVVMALVAAGFRGPYAEAKKIFTELDADDDRKITREEYVTALGKLPENDIKVMTMRQIFQAIDTDKSGLLTKAELVESVTNVKLDPETEKISQIIITLCKDATKKIDYEEFLKLYGDTK